MSRHYLSATKHYYDNQPFLEAFMSHKSTTCDIVISAKEKLMAPDLQNANLFHQKVTVWFVMFCH